MPVDLTNLKEPPKPTAADAADAEAALEQKVLDAALAAALSPASVSADGVSVSHRSPVEALDFLDRLDERKMRKQRRPLLVGVKIERGRL